MTTQDKLDELDRLESLFKASEMPKPPIRIGGYMTITGLDTFITTNLSRARLNVQTSMADTCILRLQLLERYLESEKEEKQ